VISFDALTFWYPMAPSPSLRGIDTEIDEGEYLVLAGASGSGKSTLLRCINGLIPHFYGGIFSGRVVVDGMDTRRFPVRRLSELVGFVFQDPENQFVTDSVRSEIAFGQENLGKDPAEVEERTRVLAKGLELEGLLDKNPTQISGGEKQKTIIASVVAMGTRTLLLDEPTSQLDPRSAEELLGLIRELNKDGMTIILTEHRLKRVLKDASRALVLDNGRIVFDGKPSQLPNRFPSLVSLGQSVKIHRPPKGPRIDIREVSFRYEGGSWVFRDLSLDIRISEFLGILGPNGVGKSTLARIMVRILDDFRGEVLLNGREIRSMDREEISRKIGIVFQDPNKHLFHETVEEEVSFARRNLRMPDGPKVRETLGIMGLEELASRNPRDLSGGEKEKVAIASVLGYEPEVLILDEPTRGLDLQEKARIMRTLRRLVTRKGLTVVAFTHDLEMIQAFADRAATLSKGRISFLGDPANLSEADLSETATEG